jgi:CheY-like chemotaxis protein
MLSLTETKRDAPMDLSPVTKHRILLVDDEEAILLPIARYFRALGCSVELAQEPEEAIALLRHRTYDLVITDMRLTKFGSADGLDVLRDLRERVQLANVIVMGAYISPEVEAEAIRLGATAVLRKPQNLPDLAQIVFGILGDNQ